MNRKRLKRSLLIVITISFVFTACDEKNLKVKPYPQYHDDSEKYIFNNKDFWNVDLKNDIDDFKNFTRKTFQGIKKYKEHYKEEYSSRMRTSEHKKNTNKLEKRKIKKNNYEDSDEVLDAQYK